MSEESTGISGLSAFRESHVSIGEVETVALRDVPGLDRVDLLEDRHRGIREVRLEGFPWERFEPAGVVAEFEDDKTTAARLHNHRPHRLSPGSGYDVWVSEWHPIVRYGIRHQWRRLVGSDGLRPRLRCLGQSDGVPSSQSTLANSAALKVVAPWRSVTRRSRRTTLVTRRTV